MTALIIEDERPAARQLARMLEAEKITVLHMLHSVAESVRWFESNPDPDLIFLDIQLSDGLSFEIFDTVKVQAPIIFTTAFDEYALKAFKLNSIDYLLKPIDPEELRASLDKFKNRWAESTSVTAVFEDIRKMLINPLERSAKRRFTVRVGQHIKILAADEIECFFSENKGTYAATSDGRTYLMDMALEQLEGELDPQSFFRVSRKFYVNVNYIKDIIAYSNSRLRIVLKRYEASEIIVARERVRDFKLWLE